MKTILFNTVRVDLPDLSGAAGHGSISISKDLWLEYNYKVNEVLKLSEKIHFIAAEQLGDRYPRGY